jgi:hypothetical protein
MKMSEFIDFSNFMLVNFWWVILPICAVIGLILFFMSESFFNNETINQSFIDSGIKWDKYGNPIIGEDTEQK